MIQNVDIIILGGGMVGLTVAATLKESGLRIAIIERTLFNSSEIEEKADIRVSAINRASENILSHAGVWQAITKRGAPHYYGMKVWEQDSFAHINFDSTQIAQKNLGYIVGNKVIQQCLLEQVSQQDNVTLYSSDFCSTIMFGENEVWINLNSGQGLTAKLVVGADGANSWLRNQLDIPVTRWDYGHHAIVANIQTSESHHQIARQIFRPDGPLAFLPLEEENTSSIVWSLPPLEAEKLLSMSDEQFNKVLTAAFDNQLGLCSLISERESFPLTMRYARDFVKNRAVLVGDAAHTIHPLAGQGVNLGFADAAALSETIMALVQENKDIGLKVNLRSFERWRKSEAAQMIAAMEGFKQLFSGDNSVKKFVRGVGMRLVNELLMVKNESLKKALGLSGRLPMIARK